MNSSRTDVRQGLALPIVFFHLAYGLCFSILWRTISVESNLIVILLVCCSAITFGKDGGLLSGFSLSLVQSLTLTLLQYPIVQQKAGAALAAGLTDPGAAAAHAASGALALANAALSGLSANPATADFSTIFLEVLVKDWPSFTLAPAFGFIAGLYAEVFGIRNPKTELRLREVTGTSQMLAARVRKLETTLSSLSQERIYHHDWESLTRQNPLDERLIGLLLAMGGTDERLAPQQERGADTHLFNALTRLKPEVLAIMNLDGRIIRANARLLAMYGYPATHALEGVSILDLLQPEDAARAAGAIERTLAGGLERNDCFRIRPPRLDIYDSLASFSLNPRDSNSISARYGIAAAAGSKQQTAAAKRPAAGSPDLDAGFSQLLISPEIIFTCMGSPLTLVASISGKCPGSAPEDAASAPAVVPTDLNEVARRSFCCLLPDQRIYYVDAAAADLFGKPVNALLGKRFDRFTSQKHVSRVEELRQACSKGRLTTLEIEMMPHDGRRRVFRFDAYPSLDTNGRYLGCTLLIEDISSVRLVEEALQHRLSMEKLISSISTRFISVQLADLDREITRVLEMVGEFEGAEESRVEIYRSRLIRQAATYSVSRSGPADPAAESGQSGPAAQNGESILRSSANPNGSSGESAVFSASAVSDASAAFSASVSYGQVIPAGALEQLEQSDRAIISGLIGSDALAGWQPDLDRYETISIPIVIGTEKAGHFQFLQKRFHDSWLETDLELIRVIGEIIINALIRKENELDIQLNETRLATTIHSIGEAVIATDMDGRIILMNQMAEVLTGWTRESAMNQPIEEVFQIKRAPPPTEDPHLSAMHPLSETDDSQLLVSRDGTEHYVRTNRSAIRDQLAVYGEVTVFRDVTQEKQENDEIRYVSYHDRLTGLYNRAFFEEELTRLNTERQYPITLIIGDCNGLKIANDIFGHMEGDRLLQNIARILRKVTRHEDIVARWGGDEFAIILPQTDEEAGAQIRERILQLCAEAPFDPIQPSLAMGSATNTEPDLVQNDLISVLKLAEDRMYRHKLMEGKSARNTLLLSIEKMIYEKSYETEEHATRLKEISLKLGRAVGLSSFEQEELSLLSVLHDVGKIGIPDKILAKPEQLSDDEWDIMRKHSEKGYNLAKSTPELASIADSILHHHEHWDGSGYPAGLQGEQIPKLSRILSIIDAFDVITHSRAYKQAQSKLEALREIERCAGSQFDPEIARVFIEIMKQE